MVVDRHREGLFGALLTDDIIIDDGVNFRRLGETADAPVGIRIAVGFLADDVIAKVNAFVADEHRRAGDQFADFVLTLAAERAIQQLFTLGGGAVFRHMEADGSRTLCEDCRV